MSTSTKIAMIKPNRKHKHKEDNNMKQEIVAQVHKTITSEDKDNKNDKVDNSTPSRDVSVDEESQINSKILSLIEKEMKRDVKHSHFTDSRPQSLSFYEDEKMPEELSGNLELLSPEERKHYKKRSRDCNSQLDEERNAYNVIQDLYTRDDEIISKKTKSRKKRHESELGLGDSREMMIPKEKRKKKKKREFSPGVTKISKQKKTGEEPTVKNEITLALDELQDDVFESARYQEESVFKSIKKSPRRNDNNKLYVQKRNKFELTTKNLNRQWAHDLEEDSTNKRKNDGGGSLLHPIEISIPVQEYWMKFGTLCHGLLAGLGFGHWLYIISNYYSLDEEFVSHYSHFSNVYAAIFYMLGVICMISALERLDIAHLDLRNLRDLLNYKISCTVTILYLMCLIVHLSATDVDYKLGLVLENENTTVTNVTSSELIVWNLLSTWRSSLAFLAWIVLGLSSQENLLYTHLKSMEKYLPSK